MKRERLTKKGGLNFADPNLSLADEWGYSHIYNRLAELEDKIEQGTLIELPCPYGTELHFLYSRAHYGKPQPACVYSTKDWIFNIASEGTMFFTVAGRGIGYYGEYRHELGKTVFLTREEAEKRLLELQGGK